MSKAEKPVKVSPASQLKKDLSQAGKVIQSLATSLEKIESSLSEAEIALLNERSLNERLSSVHGEITMLREVLEKAQSELRPKSSHLQT